MINLITKLDKYSVYQINNDNIGNYYIVMSNNETTNYQMLISFDTINMSMLSPNEGVSKIKETADSICSKRNNIIYVVIGIPKEELEDATRENDELLYNKLLEQRIRPITADIHQIVINMGNKNLSQTIGVIKRNDMDKKLAGWLSMKLGDNFIKEIDYNLFLREYSQDTADGGIAPVNHEFDNVNNVSKNETLVKTLTKPNNTSPGFGNIKFIIITLLSSLVVGVSIGCLLMK